MTIANLPLAILSFGYVALTIVAFTFIFAPFYLLTGGRAGFFNAITSFGTACSGFFFPISLLPDAFEVVARLFPTAWAMEALMHSVIPGNPASVIVRGWGIALLLSAFYLIGAYLLMRVVERRVTITGVLGTS